MTKHDDLSNAIEAGDVAEVERLLAFDEEELDETLTTSGEEPALPAEDHGRKTVADLG